MEERGVISLAIPLNYKHWFTCFQREGREAAKRHQDEQAHRKAELKEAEINAALEEAHRREAEYPPPGTAGSDDEFRKSMHQDSQNFYEQIHNEVEKEKVSHILFCSHAPLPASAWICLSGCAAIICGRGRVSSQVNGFHFGFGQWDTCITVQFCFGFGSESTCSGAEATAGRSRAEICVCVCVPLYLCPHWVSRGSGFPH